MFVFVLRSVSNKEPCQLYAGSFGTRAEEASSGRMSDGSRMLRLHGAGQ